MREKAGGGLSWCTEARAGPDCESEKREEPYDSFKIISKKAMADYERAKQRFLDFLMDADVWSSDQVCSPCTARMLIFC